MTGSRQSVGMAPAPGNFDREADIAASDSDNEERVHAMMEFQN